jgi:predicted AAA+ superfamily ATPase
MIKRDLSTELLLQIREYPVVTVLGPRQAGKTTLVRNVLPDYAYVSLESPDMRQFAQEDPKAFLAKYTGKVIFDEIQRTPELLSYLQVIVDETGENGQFVLTGSHQLQLREAITQSLAGRTGLLYLLPLTVSELSRADISFKSYFDYLFNGFLPRIYDQKQRPHIAYANYYQTYVERDVRQLINLKDVALFEKFLKLLAGRVGQLINYNGLANDTGVDGHTVKNWLSILEASFVIFKLPPYYENFGKRAVKSPKFYFTDTGLLSYLLDIEKPAQLERDPLIGALFENLVILEILKNRYNRAKTSGLYFYRDGQGKEIDLLYKSGNKITGIEIKAAATWNSEFKKTLINFSEKNQKLDQACVIYNGESREFSDGIQTINFLDSAEKNQLCQSMGSDSIDFKGS